MIRTEHGLRFDVSSPSHWRLMLPFPADSGIELVYVGDSWLLFVEEHGTISVQSYPTRQAAIEPVLRAFEREDLL